MYPLLITFVKKIIMPCDYYVAPKSKTKEFIPDKAVKSRLLFVSIFLLLLTASMQVSAQNNASLHVSDTTKALFEAIRSGNDDLLQQQLAKGASANDSLDGYSALMAAALNGTVGQMRQLIANGATVNYQTNRGITALWLAVPNVEKTSLLLQHGADVNHLIGGYSVLAKVAAMPGTINEVHLLVNNGANISKNVLNQFFVYNAAASGDTAILGFFLRKGFNANDTIIIGDYPIIAALAFRSYETLKMLVQNGANVNVAPFNPLALAAVQGFTPLMNACFNNDSASISYLLQQGANPNSKSPHGVTALMLLEQSDTDNTEMTAALIKYGAVVGDQQPDGTDALFYARQKGNTPTVSLLEKYIKK